MTSEKLRLLIGKDALRMLKETFSDENIKKTFKAQYKTRNLIPVRECVYDCLMQSYRIKFGNALEEIYKDLLTESTSYTLVKNITSKLPLDDEKFCKKLGIEPVTDNLCRGGGQTVFVISKRNLDLFTNYINDCTCKNPDTISIKDRFNKLVDEVKNNIKEEVINPFAYEFLVFKNDVDLFFFNKEKFYYVELKKEDNHDSDKTDSMYGKALKTFLCMFYQAYANDDPTLKIEGTFINMSLSFFGEIKTKSKILPEDYVFSGQQFFNKFMDISYDDFVDIVDEIRESTEMRNCIKECRNKVENFPDEELEKFKESLKKSA